MEKVELKTIYWNALLDAAYPLRQAPVRKQMTLSFG